jgi:hypothetical protein
LTRRDRKEGKPGSLMNADFPESRIRQIWQECPGRTDLVTEEDGPVQIIYPGRPNDGSGADFRDAVVQTSRGRLTGDIEVHVKSSHWRAHRHHRDPLYNRVVLHVVFQHDLAGAVRLENGNSVPTLALERWLVPGSKRCQPPPSPVPCRDLGRAVATGRFAGILDAAGEQRFQSRVAGYQTIASPAEAGQALYLGILAALGYARNKYPMMELAGRMPLRRLEAGIKPSMTDFECLAWYQAMLTGAAGLLPRRALDRGGVNSDRWRHRLEELWASAGEPEKMSTSDWDFCRVRPANLPARRLAAMSQLLLRFRGEGLLNGLMSQLEALPDGAGHHQLEAALTVAAGDGPGRYPCSSRSSTRDEPALLGRARAAEIAVNVILPFAVAWGRASGRPALVEKALNLYRRYPVTATNTIVRHMSRQFGIGTDPVNTARRQQGLLHIFKTWCSLGRCHDCPVNKAA